MNIPSQKKTLLLVDDEPINLQVLRHCLQDDYRLLFAKDGASALSIAEKERPDLILLDIMMPAMSGYEVCERLKQLDKTQHIPVIFVSALNSTGDEQKGFEIGAVDYISKPFSPVIVQARVKTHLQLVRADELAATRLQIIRSLGMAAEYRDNETGMHIIRLSYHAHLLALRAGYSTEDAEELFHAAPMHDVGKIGIPDHILLKPGKLDSQEWAVMKQHTNIGAHIIGEQDSSLLKLAATLARCHHEKFDGTGYPHGLSGQDIPHQARIIAIVDVFDALLSTRPYKEPWPLEDVLDLLKREKGKHFDPELVDAFLIDLDQHLAIQAQYQDTAP